MGIIGTAGRYSGVSLHQLESYMSVMGRPLGLFSARGAALGVPGEGGTLCFSPTILTSGVVRARGAKGPASLNARSSLRCVVRDALLLVDRFDLLSTTCRKALSLASSFSRRAFSRAAASFLSLWASLARSNSDERELTRDPSASCTDGELLDRFEARSPLVQ